MAPESPRRSPNGAPTSAATSPRAPRAATAAPTSHRADTIDAVTAILEDLGDAGVVELRYFDARSDWINDAGVDGAAFQA